MRTFLAETRQQYGDYTFIVEVEDGRDISMLLYDGEEPTKEQQEILDQLGVFYNPFDILDMVKITAFEELEITRI
jgi:hypothetical protein